MSLLSIIKTKKLQKQFIYKLVTSTGFGPMNAAVKGQCVKPLHQLARMAPQVGLEPTTP